MQVGAVSSGDTPAFNSPLQASNWLARPNHPNVLLAHSTYRARLAVGGRCKVLLALGALAVRGIAVVAVGNGRALHACAFVQPPAILAFCTHAAGARALVSIACRRTLASCADRALPFAQGEARLAKLAGVAGVLLRSVAVGGRVALRRRGASSCWGGLDVM